MSDPIRTTSTGQPFSGSGGFRPYPSTAPQRGPVSHAQATWAFVLALVPMPLGWVVSFGLAVTVLRDSRDGRGQERGAGLAKAALVIVTLWVLISITVLSRGGLGTSPGRDADGQATARGDVLTSSLRTGDCLPETPRVTSRASTVEVVPCSDRHAAQVFDVFRPPAGAYPGDAQLRRLAEGGCVRRYRPPSSGTAAEEPYLFFYLPSRRAWAGDRRIVCISVPADAVQAQA